MPLSQESLLQFPCEFPIKAMGRVAEDFDALVVGIVRRHVPDLEDTSISTRLSQKGNYISITVTINAQSREQVDNIYQELASNQRVLIAL